MAEIQVPESSDELSQALKDLDEIATFIRAGQFTDAIRDYILQAIREGVGQVTTQQKLVDHDFALAIKVGTAITSNLKEKN